jgi:hypothetical protein
MNRFPWKEAKGVYANAGPKERVVFAIGTITFVVAPTDERGRDTGRTRYKVDCVECDRVLHSATTGPSSHVEGHMKETHGMKRDEEIGYG